VTPFGLEEGSQFRLPPPPALRTGKYASDYNEVKLVGRIDSPFRPQDRTDVARFYAATTPVQAWNSAARQVSAARGSSLSENARTFALLAMAVCDASIAVFDTKYHYNSWRPVTAIRAGASDGNAHTDADPDWLPLIATPAFPGYASAHATLSGAARVVLERVFGKGGHAITLTNPALPTIVLDYSAWAEINDDIDDAASLRRHPLPLSIRRRGPIRDARSARTSCGTICARWMVSRTRPMTKAAGELRTIEQVPHRPAALLLELGGELSGDAVREHVREHQHVQVALRRRT
jgi:hypothetical protein